MNYSIYALFLDASKAFDRMHHSKLFNNFKDKSVCPFWMRLISIMYSFNNAAVNWNNAETDKFSLKIVLSKGLYQVLFVFKKYLDPSLKKYKKVK